MPLVHGRSIPDLALAGQHPRPAVCACQSGVELSGQHPRPAVCEWLSMPWPWVANNSPSPGCCLRSTPARHARVHTCPPCQAFPEGPQALLAVFESRSPLVLTL
eukprot:365520-Chlamydomonas_euryale.AAC.22